MSPFPLITSASLVAFLIDAFEDVQYVYKNKVFSCNIQLNLCEVLYYLLFDYKCDFLFVFKFIYSSERERERESMRESRGRVGNTEGHRERENLKSIPC